MYRMNMKNIRIYIYRIYLPICLNTGLLYHKYIITHYYLIISIIVIIIVIMSSVLVQSAVLE